MDIIHQLHDIRFQWDDQKAEINLRKHGVLFERACEVFFDPFLYALEEDVVDDELRGAVIGLTKSWRMLYVAYIIREDAIRLISARPVTRTERLNYENQ